MTKTKALAKIEELKGYVEGLDKVIMVPEGIEFRAQALYNGIGLVFNNGKQELYYNDSKRIYVVQEASSTKIKTKLTPCNYEDLVPGDWAYVCDTETPGGCNNNLYHLKTEDGMVRVEGSKYIRKAYNDGSYWFKVTEV